MIRSIRTRSKAQTETLAAIRFLERAVLDAPLEGIVVRYGGLYGPGSSEKLADILRRRMFPVIGDGAGIVSSTHVDDAAGGTLAALERGRRGIYNIVDDEPAPSREFIPAIAEALGAPRAAPHPGLARPAARWRGGGDDDDRGPRLIEREGQARARLAADLVELA